MFSSLASKALSGVEVEPLSLQNHLTHPLEWGEETRIDLDQLLIRMRHYKE
jgi:hypothetical protein